MGRLEHQASGRRVTLGSKNLIGRAPHCVIKLDDAVVSSEHARLRYGDAGWILRDLGSSNGTAIDDVPLQAGSDTPVAAGASLSFGNAQIRWVLIDDDPPRPAARREQDGQLASWCDGVLALPSAEVPACQVFIHERDGWIIEQDGRQQAVDDQHLVVLADGSWRLELPPLRGGVVTTHTAGSAARMLRSVTLRFLISGDEEYIELRLEDGDWHYELGARTFNEMLLTLGRLRLRDGQHYPDSEAEQGWVYADELCVKAGIARHQLDQYVFHARKQLARAGIANPGQIVERRTMTRQLRLGSDRVELTPL